jgi:hypothetical protein
MDGERKVSQVFNNNPQGSRLRVRQKKTNGGVVYKQILVNAKLQIGKRGQKNRAEWENINQGKVCIGM